MIQKVSNLKKITYRSLIASSIKIIWQNFGNLSVEKEGEVLCILEISLFVREETLAAIHIGEKRVYGVVLGLVVFDLSARSFSDLWVYSK